MAQVVNNTATVNDNAAAQANSKLTSIKNLVNKFIKSCPEKFAESTKKLNNVANMSSDETADALEGFYSEAAAESMKCAGFLKRIPSYANSFEVKSLEDMGNVFKTLAAEVKSAGKLSEVLTKVAKLICVSLYIIGRKVAQAAIAVAKKLTVVGIRIVAIGGSFVISVATGIAKAVKGAYKFCKTWKKVKSEESAKENAALTVDDLTEEDFEVEC